MRIEDQLAAAMMHVEHHEARAIKAEEQASASAAVEVRAPRFSAGQSVHQWWAPWMPGVLGKPRCMPD
jgi:hypothetical protein